MAQPTAREKRALARAKEEYANGEFVTLEEFERELLDARTRSQ
jgi:hypothetical protein